MPWSGGSYNKGNNATGGWVGDASLGIGIEAGRHDTQDNDFATGINQCLNKDGSNAATGNLNLGGFLPTNIGAGTAAAPAICAGNDINTGIFSAAADQIGIATNGTERVRIDATGRVGIGTTAPSGILDIQSTTVAANLTRFSADATGPEIQLQKSRSATVGTSTIVNAGDILGVLRFNGANGTNYTEGGYVAAFVDGTPGATNDMPTRLVFATSSDGAGIATERMRITNSGEVGIGNNASNGSVYRLQVGSGSGQQLLGVFGGSSGTGAGSATSYFGGANYLGSIGNYSAIQGTAYNDAFTIKAQYSLALLGITAAAGTHFMKWNNSTGAWTYDTSSARYKDNIEDTSYGLAEVLAMRPVAFTYKAEPDRHDVGFIAEEMVNVIPEVVAKNTEGEPDAISYDRLTSVLCKAIQELNAKVETLQARVAELEA